jgi:hypothetical protein
VKGRGVRSISKADAALIFQILNQLANFLTYSQRKDQVEPVADTLKSLQARMRAARKSESGLDGFEFSDDETAAVVLLIPEIIRSLDGAEFYTRTGYQPDQALATRDRLLQR